MKLISIIAITTVLLLVAVLLMGVKVLFVKGGRFPSGHAHDLPALKKKKRKKRNNNLSDQ